MIASTKEQTAHPLKNYYRWHAQVYDATRWAFLFGRNRIIHQLPFPENLSFRALEVGCGTGFNSYRLLKQYSKVLLDAVDISEDMIKIARRRCKNYENNVQWHQTAYDLNMFEDQTFDLILYSYSASMINPGWQELMEASIRHLKPGGILAVVDFHNTPYELFSRWMKYNHVEMQGQILPVLKKKLLPVQSSEKLAYGNLWTYFLFIGSKNQGL